METSFDTSRNTMCGDLVFLLLNQFINKSFEDRIRGSQYVLIVSRIYGNTVFWNLYMDLMKDLMKEAYSVSRTRTEEGGALLCRLSVYLMCISRSQKIRLDIGELHNAMEECYGPALELYDRPMQHLNMALRSVTGAPAKTLIRELAGFRIESARPADILLYAITCYYVKGKGMWCLQKAGAVRQLYQTTKGIDDRARLLFAEWLLKKAAVPGSSPEGIRPAAIALRREEGFAAVPNACLIHFLLSGNKPLPPGAGRITLQSVDFGTAIRSLNARQVAFFDTDMLIANIIAGEYLTVNPFL